MPEKLHNATNSANIITKRRHRKEMIDAISFVNQQVEMMRQTRSSLLLSMQEINVCNVIQRNRVSCSFISITLVGNKNPQEHQSNINRQNHKIRFFINFQLEDSTKDHAHSPPEHRHLEFLFVLSIISLFHPS